MAKNNAAAPMDENGNAKVQCKECQGYWHRLEVHVEKRHAMTPEAYKAKHPGAPIASAFALSVAADAAPKDPMETAPATTNPDDEPFILGAARLTMRTNLTAHDLSYVPSHDEDFDMGDRVKAQWEFLALGIESDENVMLVGPTGCGKSAGVMELASALNQPVQRINLHGDVRSSDFIGEKVIEVDEASGQSVVRWQDGVLPDAMRRGHWLLLDELDAAPPAILFTLQRVLERDDRRLVLTANHGQVIVPHPAFRIIATANTLGRGDDTGLYSGTQVLNEAFLDRFGVVIEADYPEAASEVKIVVDKSKLDKAIAERMVKLANEVRKSFKETSTFCTFSTRRLIAWSRKAAKLKSPTGGPDIRRAAEITVLNKLSPSDRKFMDGLIQRHFGGAING